MTRKKREGASASFQELQQWLVLSAHQKEFTAGIGKRIRSIQTIYHIRRKLERCNRLIAMMRFARRLEKQGYSLIAPSVFSEQFKKFNKYVHNDWRSIGVFIVNWSQPVPSGRFTKYLQQVGAQKGGIAKQEKMLHAEQSYRTWVSKRSKFGLLCVR